MQSQLQSDLLRPREQCSIDRQASIATGTMKLATFATTANIEMQLDYQGGVQEHVLTLTVY